jgi:hypothetical protein
MDNILIGRKCELCIFILARSHGPPVSTWLQYQKYQTFSLRCLTEVYEHGRSLDNPNCIRACNVVALLHMAFSRAGFGCWHRRINVGLVGMLVEVEEIR